MPETPPIPSQGVDEQDYLTLGWLQEALQESEGFLKAQAGYDRIQPSMEAVLGHVDAFSSPGLLGGALSRVRSNRIGKIYSDLKALLTDTKVFWEYRSANPNFQKQAEIAGKLSTHWFYQRQIDMRFASLVGYYENAGTSFAHLMYDETVGDITMTAEDPRDVLPIRPSEAGYESIQNCLGVIVRRERSVNYVKDRFPNKAHLIVADRDGSIGSSRGGGTAALYRALGSELSAFDAALWGENPKRTIPKMPVVDLYTAYIRDTRINKSSHAVAIGQFDKEGKPLNNWSYVVEPGQPFYPNKRLIQFTKTAILYDSTSPYWHGMFPLVKFTLDPLENSWLGKAPLWDLLPLGTMYDKVLRAMDDLLGKAVQPDVVADKQSMSRAALNALNTRAAGQKFLQNFAIGKGMQLVYPQGPGFEMGMKLIEILRQEIDTLSGVMDMSQMMRLNQLPGADTLDKIVEGMSPSVRGRSRALEAFVREFARMLAYNFAQFYTVNMRIMIMGADGVTPADMESFDPGTFIPDYVHPDDFGKTGFPTPEALARGPLQRMDRAKHFMEQFTYHVAPSSLLASSQIDKKLLYLQLGSRGLIDRQTLLEELGIPNVPQIIERLAEEQAQMAMIQAGASASATGGMEGRPPSWNAMPHLERKDGGTRSTIATS